MAMAGVDDSSLCKGTNRTLVNQTKTNSVNIRDASHVTVATDVQPLSAGATDLGCG